MQRLADPARKHRLRRVGTPGNAYCRPEGETDDLAALRNLIEAAWRSGKGELWELLSQQLERELLAFGLSQPGLSQVQMADRLGVSRNYLRARLKKYGFTEPK